MAKPEKPAASTRANRGQDEVMHTITSADGLETFEVTQREWKETYRPQGYLRTDGVDDEDETENGDNETEATPV
jgi:hypothetical protein